MIGFVKVADEDLVDKAREGNLQAWEKLIARYEKKMYNYALRTMGNREDALDLLQEVFLSVWRNLDKYRREASFSSWIFRIAANRSVDIFRKRKGVNTFEELDDLQLELEGEDPAAIFTKNETNRVIMNLLGRLPEDQRLVIELKFFQQRTFEEIGEMLAISTNTVKSRLYAAIKKLQADPEVIHAM